ncbi:MAG TPA: TonB-dependent receptor [Rhodanobacteraceae bacterium]|nr:TonB-dependent receptor [Rhodanobacteraceae bacterium]
MTYRKTMLSASIVAALMFAGAAAAHDSQPKNTQPAQPQASQQDTNQTDQSTTADQKKAKELDTITVVGVRNAAALSLELKKAAVSDIEVVTAEDVGKLPAKNVADALQMLPGVSVGTSSAGEGGFDENDRVSLRGTNPSMTLTQVNGHTIGTGDWFVLNQTATVGRSVSYSMLPSEIVSEVVVHKSSEARLNEGGAAGTVNIITRKPLQFADKYTTHLTVGTVYSDLPGKYKPQFSGLFNFKNDADTFGFMVQGFYEKRSLERYGQELLGLEPLAAGDAIVAAHPDLEGVYVPTLLGNVLFTQERTRKGGSVGIQFRPSDNLSINLEGFYSKLEADNYNRNYMMWGTHWIHGATNLDPGYVVRDNTLQHANFTPTPGDTTGYGIYDQISRAASASTQYITADVDWQATNTMSFHAQVGNTEGHGKSPYQDVFEMNTAPGQGAGWTMRGVGQPVDWHLGPDNSTPAASGASANWIFGEGGIDVVDKENWIQIDSELDFNTGALESLQYGLRYADHTRKNDQAFAQGAGAGFNDPANFPQTIGGHYPGDFGSKLGANVPANVWYYSTGALHDFDAQYATRGPDRLYPNDIYKVKEKDGALYFQANFSGDRWAGNVGVRYVHTKEDIGYSSSSPLEADYKGPIMGSAFFPNGWYFNTHQDSYNKFLPSANLKFHLTDNLIARVAASQTLTRPDYSALAGSTSLDDTGHTGSGGNPNLQPLISTNFDASLGWYFAPRGLVSIGVYNMSLNNYVDFGFEDRSYKDMPASNQAGHDVYSTYRVSVPTNVDGNVRGVELNYQQPLGKYMGLNLNYTYAAGHTANGGDLQGTSKNSANASFYFENDRFNARVSYSYRSSYYAGPDRAGKFYLEGTGYLSAAVGYDLTDWMSINLVGRNLNNPELKYYVKSPAYNKQPRSFYINGRQYYLTLRFKF